MNKMMIGASALAIASVAGAAAAQEWNVGLSGGTVAGFGYIDSDGSNHDTVVINRADVTMNAKLVADNGLTFGAYIVFLVDGKDNIVEDGYGTNVSGSFGQVRVGEENGAHRRALPRVPRTAFVAAGRGGGLLFDGDYNRNDTPARGLADDRGANTGTSQKITYLTPRFSGLQAGVSYAVGADPDKRGAATDTINSPRDGEGIEFGLNYTETFNGISVAVGGGYTEFLNNGGPNDAGWAIGGQLGYAGFAFGATYGVQDARTGSDVEMLALGGTYSTGPWSFGLGYGINLDGSTSGRNRDGDYGVSIGVDYALAPGVKTGVGFEYIEADVASGDDSAFSGAVFLGLNF